MQDSDPRTLAIGALCVLGGLTIIGELLSAFDRLRMAATTKGELANLPTTEPEDER